MNEVKTKIIVKVPRKYAKRKYLDAIGMGLYDLSLGVRPDPKVKNVESDDLISARIKLSPKATEFWEWLLPQYEHNQRRLVHDALHLVSLEPEHLLQCRI